MKLMSVDYDKDWTLLDFTVAGNIRLQSPTHLDGGGILYKEDLVNAIRQTGKPKYKRAFEWCAGFGAIGFEVFGQGLCEHIVFSDYYDVAINDCNQTAKNNNIVNQVTGYTSSTINGLPDSELWDLVVANPPWSFSEQKTIAGLGSEFNPAGIPNMLRILVDDNYNIHREFFNNIKAHLTEDADVYIIEGSRDPAFIIMALQGGLQLVNIYDAPKSGKYLKDGGIFHFKPS
jgi:filamentous hemagglutinin family protein